MILPDQIAEKLLSGVLLMLKWVFEIFLFRGLLFNLGRFSLLALTGFRYPREKHIEKHFNRIITFGLFEILILWFFIAAYNNYMR